MPKHRGHREGTITQRKDGRWEAKISLDNGKRKAFYGKTRAEARDKLTAALRDQQKGLPIAGPSQTMEKYLSSWLEDAAKLSVRPRTYARYAELIRLHILPALGKKSLQKLAPQELRTLYAQKLKEGLSPRTVGHIHRLLHCALENAVRWNLVPRNICDLLDAPKVAKQEIRALSPDQAKALLAAAQTDKLQALYVLALTTGMRQGELFGLKWQDIDLASGSLQVRRSLGRLPGKGFFEQEPKSSTSNRNITLTPLAIAALKQHRAQQLEARLMLGSEWVDLDLVFANSIGRPLTPQNMYRRSFWPLLERASLPKIRFHDLRHSAASLLLSLGTHPKIVQEILGHSQISVTMDTYTHALPTLQSEAMGRLGALLEGRA